MPASRTGGAALANTPLLPALLLSLAVLPWPASAQSISPPHLIPMPHEFHPLPDQPLSGGVHIVCASCPSDVEDRFTFDDLAEALHSRHVPTDAGPGGLANALTIQLNRLATHPDPSFTEAMKPEGYTIATTPALPITLTLTAATSAGLFYAAQTVKQLIEGDGPRAILHAANLRDWPAMKYRGLHDDLSRGPVPTLDFQKHLIRTLAAYKINLYSPYFEHTQQYASNPLPAPPGGSISAADAQTLVAYALQFHITVAPEQEAFGHLHHNLTWEVYQPLAETPHGAVLAPAQPGSLPLIHQMFSELATLYPGPFLHIGADETVDLGLGQTKSDVDTRGLGPVYLDFLQRIVTDLKPLNRRLLFWGDIAQEVNQTSPDLLKSLPAGFKQSTIAIPWQYNPEANGFARFITPFSAAGFETWVAPGVNNWSRVYPDNNDALPNIQGFIRDGQRLGSTGALNAIWYDDGEALANNNWYGILFGAAAAWQSGESSIPAFQQSFAQVFHNDLTGALNQAQIEVMAAHALLRNQAKVGDGSDGLFWIDPLSKDGLAVAAKIRPYTHDLRLHAEQALILIAKARTAAGPDVAGANELSSRSDRSAAQKPASFTFYDASAYGAATSSLRNPEAIDALELGARRLDLIGLKFQLADEIAQGYERALAAAQSSTDKKTRLGVGRELSDINGVNGRLEDIKDTYALLRDMYEAAWLASNRPYALRPVLEHYDATIALWLARADRIRSAQRQWADSHTLPPAADMGLPVPPPPPRP